MIELFKKFTRENFVYYLLISIKKVGLLLKWGIVFSPIIVTVLQLLTPILPALYPPKPIDTGLKTLLAIFFWLAILEFGVIVALGYFKSRELSNRIDQKIKEFEHENES